LCNSFLQIALTGSVPESPNHPSIHPLGTVIQPRHTRSVSCGLERVATDISMDRS
jgi:hypothetical protein